MAVNAKEKAAAKLLHRALGAKPCAFCTHTKGAHKKGKQCNYRYCDCAEYRELS